MITIYQNPHGKWYWTITLAFSRPIGPFENLMEAVTDCRNVTGAS
jgi:hypothetical protein